MDLGGSEDRGVSYVDDDYSADSWTAENASYHQLIGELLEQLNLGRDCEQLLDSVYLRLAGMVPYNRIAVAIIEGESPRLRLISCRTDGEVSLKIGYAARLRGSTLEHLIETGQARIINDLEAYQRTKPHSSSTRLIRSEGMQSNLTLPLVADGKPIGVVFFSSRQPHAYTRQHATLLRRLAGHLAISIEKARWADELQSTNARLAEANVMKDRFLEVLRDEVSRQTEQLRLSEQRYRLLVRLGQLVTSSLNLREVFERAAVELHRLVGCDWVSLQGAEAAIGESGPLAIEFDLQDKPTWSAPAGAAVDSSTGRLSVRGMTRQGRWPLEARGQHLGWLAIGCTDPDQEDDWDMELLKEIAAQLSVAIDNASAYGKIARLKRQLEQQNVYLKEEIRSDHSFGDIIGTSEAMRQVRLAIRQVAGTDSTVLIMGETGTGKELIARAIHDQSERHDKLMVKVNCAALSASLITSELFGHEPGAFTGATAQRVGRFELADGGTILLDEISEVPPETQVMLLRVLQERVFERVGGNQPIEVNTRVIAATNRDLSAYAAEGHFRTDLFYRLHVFPIRIPPLRDRKEDIPLLLDHFVRRFSERMNKRIDRIPRGTMDLLIDYAWPGNVRELENLVQRATIVSAGHSLMVDASWLQGPDGSRPKGTPASASEPRPGEFPSTQPQTLAETERQAILAALHARDGRVYGAGGAAKALGLKPTTLYGKMRKLGIQVRRQPDRERRQPGVDEGKPFDESPK
ncbi:MAG: GAF domain-containing protein [Planctomycetaceae bacterium]|nr:MAG: GAF domain-containing protein [Planctomycetaceae bacterium]